MMGLVDRNTFVLLIVITNVQTWQGDLELIAWQWRYCGSKRPIL